MKKILSNIWFWVVAAFSVLLVMLGMEKSKRGRAELGLLKAETDGKDAVLEEKKNQAETDIKKEEELQDKLSKELEAKKNENLTKEEILKFWNKKS